MAITVAGKTAQANLDLGSSNRSIATSSNFAPTVLAGTNRSISPGSMVTPAEFVALHQVLTTGQQTLNLNAVGAAVGGSVNFSAAMSQAVRS